MIVAHVDHPGVTGGFSRLKDLRPGAEIAVRRHGTGRYLDTIVAYARLTGTR